MVVNLTYNNSTIKKGDLLEKIKYRVPKNDWHIEAIFANGIAFSETARPTVVSRKKAISLVEANVIADYLFPKKDRGRYRKQVKNAHFTSHFFENGVVSFETAINPKTKQAVGYSGVRN